GDDLLGENGVRAACPHHLDDPVPAVAHHHDEPVEGLEADRRPQDVADQRLPGGGVEDLRSGRGAEPLAESRGEHDDGETVWRRHRPSLTGSEGAQTRGEGRSGTAARTRILASKVLSPTYWTIPEKVTILTDHAPSISIFTRG